MARMLGNWLEGYLEYTSNTESATVFHEWTGRSVLSAAMRKKLSLSLGRISIYANTYVVLVAEPGIARKSQAITYGLGLLAHITDIRTSADAITKEALIQELSDCGCVSEDIMPDGTMMRSANLAIISKEFETFLGQKKENTKMIILLTDLFDAQEMPWKYQTKHGGTDTIPSVYMSILGATTPESLASCLPVQAIGGGLTSRMLFVWASKKAKKVAKPVLDPRTLELREALINDLHIISRMSGVYQMSPDADAFWCDWYENYDEQDPKRICKDPSFGGWYARKPMYILKMAMTHAAATSDELILDVKHIEQGLKDIESLEPHQAKVFSSIGRSNTTQETEQFLNVVRTRRDCTEAEILAALYRDMDYDKFKNVAATVVRAGFVERYYQRGETRGIFYRITIAGMRGA